MRVEVVEETQGSLEISSRVIEVHHSWRLTILRRQVAASQGKNYEDSKFLVVSTLPGTFVDSSKDPPQVRKLEDGPPDMNSRDVNAE
jgi:hypothetical protein